MKKKRKTVRSSRKKTRSAQPKDSLLSSIDLRFMRLAVKKAARSRNAQGKVPIYVGAVLAKGRKILAKACRGERSIGDHAEFTALQIKLPDADLKGATLYVTLEPCITGSHPGEKYRWPCAHWVVDRGIKKVWIGDLDPNQNIMGRGAEYLEYNEINKISVDYFPSSLRQEIRHLNKEFIAKQQKRLIVSLANRTDEKKTIWRLLAQLQFQERGGSRLLWFCGQPGIGKSELIMSLRAAAEERKILDTEIIVLSENPAILSLLSFAGGKPIDIEEVQKIGASPADYVAGIVASRLGEDKKARVLIIDTDYRFQDIEGLSELVNRILTKLELAPQVGIVVATRNPPVNLNFLTVNPLDPAGIEELLKIKKWRLDWEKVKQIYDKSGGNPFLVILFNALITYGGDLGSHETEHILRDIFRHFPSQALQLLNTLGVALTAPFENINLVHKEIMLTAIPEGEKTIRDMVEVGLLQVEHSKLFMHDELVKYIEKSLQKEDKKRIHERIGIILKDTDPLGALWHFMKAEDAESAVALFHEARNSSLERLEIMRLIKTFGEFTTLLGDLSKQQTNEETKAQYLYLKAMTLWVLAEVDAQAENCGKAIEALKETLKVRTVERFPEKYGFTQVLLASVYHRLAEVENQADNCRAAIQASEQAQKICQEFLTLQPQDPTWAVRYYSSWTNIGAAYQRLAEVEAKAENCKMAVKALEIPGSFFDPVNFPLEYSMIQHNLGAAYRTLAEVENKSQNCGNAITAYEKALSLRKIDSALSLAYAFTQLSLGITYGMLAEVENKSQNCKEATKAYNEAKKVFTKTRFPGRYQVIENNLQKLRYLCEDN